MLPFSFSLLFFSFAAAPVLAERATLHKSSRDVRYGVKATGSDGRAANLQVLTGEMTARCHECQARANLIGVALGGPSFGGTNLTLPDSRDEQWLPSESSQLAIDDKFAFDEDWVAAFFQSPWSYIEIDIACTPKDGVCEGVLPLHPKWAGQNKWNETTQIDIPEYPKAKITVPPVELHIRLSVQRPVNVTLNYNTFERYTHSSFGLILVPLSAPSNVITRGWYNMSTDINRDDAFDTSVEGLEMEGSISLRPSLQWDIARNEDGADSDANAYQGQHAIDAPRLDFNISQLSGVTYKCKKPFPHEWVYDNLTYGTVRTVYNGEGGEGGQDEVVTQDELLACASFFDGRLVFPVGGAVFNASGRLGVTVTTFSYLSGFMVLLLRWAVFVI